MFVGLFIFMNTSYASFAYDAFYFQTNEANPLIEYVRTHIKDDESLYVCSSSRHVVRYKNGYDSGRIGNSARDNIIWGGERMNWSRENQNNMEEFKRIAEAKKCYLLFSHTWETSTPQDIQSGLEKLKQFGDVREVMVFQGTPLYYFTAKQAP
jgi:hypothetical protein